MKNIEYLKQISNSKGINPLTNEIKYNYLLFPVGITEIYLDLERLNQINNVWHKNNPMESVDINANHLQDTYDVLNFYIDKCEKLQNNIKKLFNVIEILKEICSLNCDKTLETERQFLKLTQEEYELLKEVFTNE